MSPAAIIQNIPVKTKFGIFWLQFSEKGLCSVLFPGASRLRIPGLRACLSLPRPGVRGVLRKFKDYFYSSGESFRELGIDLSACTVFQRRVFSALRKVPAGDTVTYGELAIRAGYPGASRAVGSAMKKNRLPVVIPCHRVLPASGGLGEYSAGKQWKELLLAHEGVKTR